MENKMRIKSDGSDVWAYVVVGSVIGGTIGYLFMTESGRRIRHTITHPDELADDLEDARHFIERNARIVTEQVHDVLSKAKCGIEEGERAYHEAERKYQLRARQIEGKNNEIASSVHRTVDDMSRTAVTVEKSVLDPICELAALYRGVERGVRTVLGKAGPTPIYRDIRIPAAERR